MDVLTFVFPDEDAPFGVIGYEALLVPFCTQIQAYRYRCVTRESLSESRPAPSSLYLPVQTGAHARAPELV
jgi:hypothetical protein